MRAHSQANNNAAPPTLTSDHSAVSMTLDPGVLSNLSNGFLPRENRKVNLTMDQALLILNGPGLAEPSGGDVTLEQIQRESETLCEELGMNLDFRQTDDPNELSRWITEDSRRFDALIINPADGYGSDDEALKAMRDLGRPMIEVHLTNVFQSGTEHAKPMQGPNGETGFICGLGLHGYLLGIKAVAKRLQG